MTKKCAKISMENAPKLKQFFVCFRGQQRDEPAGGDGGGWGGPALRHIPTQARERDPPMAVFLEVLLSKGV
jgi:hypothetical protein